MMDNHQIHEAMSFLDSQLVQEAAHPVKRKKPGSGLCCWRPAWCC